MTLGNSIKAKRKQYGWTLNELADKTGLSKSYLSEIESNTKFPRFEQINRICKALEIPVSAFFLLTLEKEDVNEIEDKEIKKQLMGISKDLKKLYLKEKKKEPLVENRFSIGYN